MSVGQLSIWDHRRPDSCLLYCLNWLWITSRASFYHIVPHTRSWNIFVPLTQPHLGTQDVAWQVWISSYAPAPQPNLDGPVATMRQLVLVVLVVLARVAVYGVRWLCHLIGADLPARHARDIRSRPDTQLKTNLTLLSRVKSDHWGCCQPSFSLMTKF